MTLVFRSVCLALTFLLLLISADATWAADGEVMREPSWKYNNMENDDDTLGVTSIMVTLKPHARSYAYRHYDWGDGKTEDRYEEMMSEKEVQKLGKAAGVELRLAPIPEKLHVIREDEPVSAKEIHKLNKIVGGELINGYQLLSLPYLMTPKEARAIAAKLARHPDVEFAEPSLVGHEQRIPNDALYIPSQWNLQQSAGGANLPPAWDTNIGGSNIVVAVLDGGISPVFFIGAKK